MVTFLKSFVSSAIGTGRLILIAGKACMGAEVLVFHFSSSGYPDKQHE